MFWMRRDAFADHLVGDAGGGSGEKIIIWLGFALFLHNLPLGICRPRDPKMRINVAVKGKSDVHQVLHHLKAVALNIAVNAQGMCHGIIDHVAICRGKHGVVLEKIHMTEHVRRP